MNLQILQWNARGINQNLQEFKHFIYNSNPSPDIICIQETLLKTDKEFKLTGYETIRFDQDKSRRGLMICIKTSLSYFDIKRHQNVEAMSVKVIYLQDKIIPSLKP